MPDPTGRGPALVLTALAPVTWGTSYYVFTEWLPPDRPLLAAAVRALPAGLLLLALAPTLPGSGRWWWRAAVLGTLNIGAFFALLFVSATHLPGGVAATLGAVQPLVVLALSSAVLAERVAGRQVVAGVAGVLGVGLLVLRGDAALDAVGVGAGLLAALSMAAGVVLTKRWGRPPSVSSLSWTGWILVLGGLVLLPVVAVVEGLPGSVTGRNAIGFGYLVVVNTAVAYAVWIRGIQLLPASQVTYLGLLSPVVATLVGWALLGEGLTPVQSVGLAVALGSVVAAQHAPRPRPGPPSTWPDLDGTRVPVGRVVALPSVRDALDERRGPTGPLPTRSRNR